MSILQQAGLVARRKDGRWHYYRLMGKDATPLVKQALKWSLKALENEKIIVADAKTLCCVRSKDREETSACYSKN
jgi:DNA-binding transcriptional ArsR family regulator